MSDWKLDKIRIAELAERTLTENPDIPIYQLAEILQCSRPSAYQWKRRLGLIPQAKPTSSPYKAGFAVYRIINDVNKMQYIGSTTMDISRRWAQHRNATLSEKQSWKPLYRDMLKYGIDHFTIELVAECGDELEMRQQETRAILQHNTIWPHGYNLKTGRMRDVI